MAHRLKRFFTGTLFLAMITAVSPAVAGCYSDVEVEAEQAIRIHSELMVIGLTCQKMPNGHGLYAKYQQFTQKNQYLLETYETDLIDYFRKQGEANPEKRFHNLRTTLANKISQHAIRMSTVSFCRAFAPRIDKALSMDQSTFRRWAQHKWPNQPTTQPACGTL